MLLARSINPSAPTLFHAPLSPYAKSYKHPRGQTTPTNSSPIYHIDTAPKKLEWTLYPELRAGIRFAETRLSDLICQNDCQALEFKAYGKNFITSHGLSPDAFVQMAFQAAYYGLYGRIECTYEPAMTKAFLHGRTEAIRTVQPHTVEFLRAFFSEAHGAQKVALLRKACQGHVGLTKECSKGLGQDRCVVSPGGFVYASSGLTMGVLGTCMRCIAYCRGSARPCPRLSTRTRGRRRRRA